MRREDDQILWDLLGQTKQPAVSPFFARNVLRTVRSKPVFLRSLGEWFGLRRLVPAATIAVALIVAVFVARTPVVAPQFTGANGSDPVAKIDPQDYDVVADLDELLASDENTLWDDYSSL